MKVSHIRAVTVVLVALLSTVVATATAFAPINPHHIPRQANSRPPRFHTKSTSGSKPFGEFYRHVSEPLSSHTTVDTIPRGGATFQQGAPPPPQPTLRQFQQFALPCLGLWVAQPLLSLVDTAFVGLSGDSSSSARQLAALGPATTFFDGATYLFAFLNVATTNLYSSARAQAGEQSERAESVVRTASRVATRCGLGIMLCLFALTRPLLALYIGT